MKNYIVLMMLVFAFSSCDLVTKGIKALSKNNQDKEITKVDTTSSEIKNGSKKFYYPTGELKSIVNYENNKKVGISITYYKTGEKQYEIPYQDGKKQGIVKWFYKNGKLYRETEYHNGKINGFQKKYWENGKLKSEMLFKEDKPAIGLKEFNNKGVEKSVPSIQVEKVNLLATSGNYVIKFRLSNGRKKVQFYQGELIEGKYFVVNGVSRIMEIETNNGVGEVSFMIPKGYQLENDFHLIALETTAYQNDRVLFKTIPISIRNPK